MARLAEAFDVSPNVVRTLSVEAGIPLPGNGYWTRRRCGKELPPPALPPRPPGASEIITLGTYGTWWRRRSEMLSDPIPPEPHFPQTVAEVVAQVTPPTPAQPRWRGGPAPTPARGRPAVLLTSLRERLGSSYAEFRHGPTDPHEFRIRCGAHWLTLSLKAVDPANTSDGRLELVLHPGPGHAQRSFADTAEDRLEAQIDEISVAILSAAESDYRVAALQHYRWCLDRRRDAERDARERRTKARKLLRQRREAREDERRRLLYAQADAWRTARDIRGLVGEVMAQAEAAGSAGRVANWADWARAEADALDPLLNDTLAPPKS
jgi:hypothetical protein